MSCIKDLIHGYISIPNYIKKIIDTPMFQRLSRIKQLTSAEYVFPAAKHDRKNHSIGVMHLANKYASHLFNNINAYNATNDYKIKLITIAGLLHDIAHSAYSHSWDSTVYSEIYPETSKGHDIHRNRIVRETYRDILISINVDPEDIIRIWNGTGPESALLKSDINIDRFDFINRDTFYTGTTSGTFEIDRIIHYTSIIDGKLVYDEKIIPDIVQGLTSRLFMYKQVYLHKTVIAVAVLIELMIKESRDYLRLVERTKNLNEFVYLNDEYILNTILHSDVPELFKAKEYARRIYERKLPKMIKEEIIYLDEYDENHRENIIPDHNNNDSSNNDNGNEVVWTSRILTTDFVKGFMKYNTYVKTKTQLLPFAEYYNLYHKLNDNTTYYIRRIYKLGEYKL